MGSADAEAINPNKETPWMIKHRFDQ